MITTPLITKIKSDGGTLYTFTSTSKDLTKVATNSANYKLKFSHFACLNLPHIMKGNMTMMNYKNYVSDRVFRTLESYIEGDVFHIDFSLTPEYENRLLKSQILFVKPEKEALDVNKYSLENNNVIIHNFTIDNIIDQNKNVIRFKLKLYYDDNSEVIYPQGDNAYLEYNVDYVGNNTERGMYLERFDNYQIKNDYNISVAEHFQNYILNFESVILNDVDYDPNILRTPAERLFFNWLRKIGAIRFKQDGYDVNKKPLYVEDVNTYDINPDVYLDRTVQYLGNIDTINQVEVNGDIFGEVYLYIPGSVGATPEIKFRAIQDNNYSTEELYTWGSEKIAGRDNFLEEDTPVDGIGLKAIYDGDDGGNYYQADEGFCIDFRNSSYDTSIEVMNAESYINFEFNCVLIYYQLIKDDGTVLDYANNLYGVLFLDNFQRSDISKTDNYLAYISGFPKFRSSELDDGNAFALKVDLKIDTAPSTTMIRNTEDVYDDPNNTRGFMLYMNAMEELHKCIDIFFTQQNEIYAIQDRVENLESIIYTLSDYNELKTQIEIIKNMLKGQTSSTNDRVQMLSLIMDNASKINKLVNGVYPTKLALDTSKIHVENGLEILPSDNDNINIENTLQKYKFIGRVSLNDEVEGDYIYPVNNVVSFNLNNNSNLVLLEINDPIDTDIILDEELVFNINEKNTRWRNGQSVEFVVSGDFKFNKIRHKNLKIQTTLKNGVVKTIKEFTKEELQKMKLKNEIEIVCLNDDFSSDNNFISIIR